MMILLLFCAFMSSCSADVELVLSRAPVQISTEKTEVYKIRGQSDAKEVLFSVYRGGQKLEYSYRDTQTHMETVTDSTFVNIYYNRTTMVTVRGLNDKPNGTLAKPTIRFKECTVRAAADYQEMTVAPDPTFDNNYVVYKSKDEIQLEVFWYPAEVEARVLHRTFSCQFGTSRLIVQEKRDKIKLKQSESFDFAESSLLQISRSGNILRIRLQEKNVKQVTANGGYPAYVYETPSGGPGVDSDHYIIYRLERDVRGNAAPYCVLEVYYVDGADECTIETNSDRTHYSDVRSDNITTSIPAGKEEKRISAGVLVQNGSVFLRLWPPSDTMTQEPSALDIE